MPSPTLKSIPIDCVPCGKETRHLIRLDEKTKFAVEYAVADDCQSEDGAS